MKILDRHVSRTVMLSMLVVLVLITSLDVIFVLVDELGEADGNYSVANALQYVAYTMPSGIYEMLPFIALGGALIGLGILASNNELIVLQSAGVRNWRIILSVLKPTALIMLLSLLLGEFVAPPLDQFAASNKALQKSGTALINPELGVWRKVGDQYIHINAIAPGGEVLYGVSRYELGADRDLARASFAETAIYQPDADPVHWRLLDVSSSYFEETRVRTERMVDEDWFVELTPELLSVLLVEPDYQSISGLYRFARFFEEQGLDSTVYFLAFWKKLLQPVSTLALVVLAISFVFGPLREATMGLRLLTALLIAFGFTLLQRMLEPLSLLYGLDPILAVLIPVAIAGGGGYYFISRVR